MRHIVEFIDHKGNTRRTEPFNSLLSARLAQAFMPIWLPSRIVPECEVKTEEKVSKNG